MKKDQIALEAELSRWCAESECRVLEGKPLKAAWIEMHYYGDLDFRKLPLQSFSKFLEEIEKGLWSLLCGHTTLKLNRSDYLAECHLSDLVEEIDQKLKAHKGLTKDEIMTKVYEYDTLP